MVGGVPYIFFIHTTVSSTRNRRRCAREYKYGTAGADIKLTGTGARTGEWTSEKDGTGGLVGTSSIREYWGYLTICTVLYVQYYVPRRVRCLDQPLQHLLLTCTLPTRIAPSVHIPARQQMTTDSLLDVLS